MAETYSKESEFNWSRTARDSEFTNSESVTLADEASLILGDSDDTSTYNYDGLWAIRTGATCGYFVVSGSTVAKVVALADADWDDADTDGDSCFFISSGALTLKNRSGGQLTYVISRLSN